MRLIDKFQHPLATHTGVKQITFFESSQCMVLQPLLRPGPPHGQRQTQAFLPFQLELHVQLTVSLPLQGSPDAYFKLLLIKRN